MSAVERSRLALAAFGFDLLDSIARDAELGTPPLRKCIANQSLRASHRIWLLASPVHFHNVRSSPHPRAFAPWSSHRKRPGQKTSPNTLSALRRARVKRAAQAREAFATHQERNQIFDFSILRAARAVWCAVMLVFPSIKKKRMSTSRRRTYWLLAASVLVGSPGLTSGELNLDLRATGLNGFFLPAGSTPKNVIVTHVGDVLWFDVFAVVVGTNAVLTDDKIISVAGSFASTGSIHGDLLLDLVRTNPDPPVAIYGFTALGSSIGLQQDLDGDGDIDVGSNVDSRANDFWAARYDLAPTGANAGSTSPTTAGRKIGFGTFTVTAINGSPTDITDISFIGRDWSTAATYRQDGITRGKPSTLNLLPLRLQAPEPPIMSLAIGALILTRLRRARSHRGIA